MRHKINYEARQKLKEELYRLYPYCALSGVKTNQLEMHEWLVKRSALPIKRIQDKIFSQYNCILLSHKQHNRTDSARRDWECARWAIRTYSYAAIEEWLVSIQLKTFGTFEQWLSKTEYFLKIPSEESLIGDNNNI